RAPSAPNRVAREALIKRSSSRHGPRSEAFRWFERADLDALAGPGGRDQRAAAPARQSHGAPVAPADIADLRPQFPGAGGVIFRLFPVAARELQLGHALQQLGVA